MARGRDRWAIWAVPVVILVGGIALRVTDRVWFVDLLDVPGLSERGNVALGFVVGAAWYMFFPPIAYLVGRISARGRPSAITGALMLSMFAALGALAIVAFPNRYESAYNEALDGQVPGFSAGIVAGTVPLLTLGLVIWIGRKALDRQDRRDRQCRRGMHDR